jgi:hypothetical protein
VAGDEDFEFDEEGGERVGSWGGGLINADVLDPTFAFAG